MQKGQMIKGVVWKDPMENQEGQDKQEEAFWEKSCLESNFLALES